MDMHRGCQGAFAGRQPANPHALPMSVAVEVVCRSFRIVLAGLCARVSTHRKGTPALTRLGKRASPLPSAVDAAHQALAGNLQCVATAVVFPAPNIVAGTGCRLALETLKLISAK